MSRTAFVRGFAQAAAVKCSISPNAQIAPNVATRPALNMYKQLNLRFERKDNQMEFGFLLGIDFAQGYRDKLKHFIWKAIYNYRF